MKTNKEFQFMKNSDERETRVSTFRKKGDKHEDV